MKKNIKRTINYYSVHIDTVSEESFSSLAEKALLDATTVGERLLERKDKSIFVNSWSRSKYGLKITCCSFDPGYRPKKIIRNLQKKSVPAEEIQLAEKEQCKKILFAKNLFLCIGYVYCMVNSNSYGYKRSIYPVHINGFIYPHRFLDQSDIVNC